MATILVVDDSAVDRRLAGGLLQKNPDLTVSYAANGFEAYAKIQQQPPDLVVTDLLMPDMNGLELVQAIRDKYPLIPVILMTAHGSEEVAVQALLFGAASYVPKAHLASDLVDTVENVLAVARADRTHERLIDCLATTHWSFVLDHDATLLPPLVDHVQQHVSRMRLCDETGRIRLGIAVEEALANALYHGNLEVSTQLREEDEQNYYRVIRERRAQAPYKDRRIHVSATISRDQAKIVIRDEGPGFDVSTIPDPTDPANLSHVSGRGLVLMRMFMDEVRFNPPGNEVTLIKRAVPDGATATD